MTDITIAEMMEVKASPGETGVIKGILPVILLYNDRFNSRWLTNKGWFAYSDFTGYSQVKGKESSEVVKWITEDMLKEHMQAFPDIGVAQLRGLNLLMTRVYGKPLELRRYKGDENPEDYGMDRRSKVMVETEFRRLEQSDIWMEKPTLIETNNKKE